MGKRTGLFKKILAGVLSFSIMFGAVTPVLANEKEDKTGYIGWLLYNKSLWQNKIW